MWKQLLSSRDSVGACHLLSRECLMAGPLLRKKPFEIYASLNLAKLHILVSHYQRNILLFFYIIIFLLIPSKTLVLPLSPSPIRSSLTWISDTDSSPCVVSLSYLYLPWLAWYQNIFWTNIKRNIFLDPNIFPFFPTFERLNGKWNHVFDCKHFTICW